MADNVTVDTITGSPVVATDDIAGVHYQEVKLAHGAADAATLVSTASGLPVQQQGTWTEANSAAILADTAAIDTATAAINAKLVTGTVIGDVNLGATDTTALQLIDNPVVAHDAAVSGSTGIFVVGGTSQNMDDTPPPNRISAEADATRMAMDWDGAQFAHPHGPQIWKYNLATSTAQTDTQIHASAGANLCLYVTDIVFSSVGTAAMNLFLEESTTTVAGPFYLPATASGVHIQFQTPLKMTAATALTYTTSASQAHSVAVTGFVGRV